MDREELARRLIAEAARQGLTGQAEVLAFVQAQLGLYDATMQLAQAGGMPGMVQVPAETLRRLEERLREARAEPPPVRDVSAADALRRAMAEDEPAPVQVGATPATPAPTPVTAQTVIAQLPSGQRVQVAVPAYVIQQGVEAVRQYVEQRVGPRPVAPAPVVPTAPVTPAAPAAPAAAARPSLVSRITGGKLWVAILIALILMAVVPMLGQIELPELTAQPAEQQVLDETAGDVTFRDGTLTVLGNRAKLLELAAFQGFRKEDLVTKAWLQEIVRLSIIIFLMALLDAMYNMMGRNTRGLIGALAVIPVLLLPNGWLLLSGMTAVSWFLLRVKEEKEKGETWKIVALIGLALVVLYTNRDVIDWLAPYLRAFFELGNELRWMAWIPIVVGVVVSFRKGRDATGFAWMLTMLSTLAQLTGRMPFLEETLSGEVMALGWDMNAFTFWVYTMRMTAIVILIKELSSSLSVKMQAPAGQVAPTLKASITPIAGLAAYFLFTLGPAYLLSAYMIRWRLTTWFVIVVIGLGYLLRRISKGLEVGNVSYMMFRGSLGDCANLFDISIIPVDGVALYAAFGIFLLSAFVVVRPYFGV